ncbi:MAG: tetratricopeptide repeat-containing diguanylate cyclase [Caldilineaceae bacterium]
MALSLAEFEAQIAAATTAEQKVDTLNELAALFDPRDPQQSLAFAQRAVALAAATNYTPGLAKGESSLGKSNIRLGRLDQAMLHYTNALAEYEKLGHAERIAAMLVSIGFLHYSLGDYASAQQAYLRSMEFSPGVSPRMESQALNNIAINYIELGDFTNALDYLLRSLALARASKEAISTSAVLDSLADLHLRMRDLPKALEYAQESLTLARTENLDFDINLGISLITLGKIYLAMQDYPQAVLCFQEAATVSGEVTANHRIATALHMLGVTFRCQGEFHKATCVLEYVLNLTQELGTRPLQADCLGELAQCYKALSNYQQALAYYEQFHETKESIFNERTATRFKTLQIVHEVEKARKEAELYQLRNVELQHEIEQREHAQAALEDLATKDPLTGLFNRRHFFTLATKQFTQALSYRRPLSVLLLDVDHFKLVNDTYGHRTGDQALQSVAEQLRRGLRVTDIISRYAGDEFIILLPETDGEQAIQVAERLRFRIEAQELVASISPARITISFGVATLDAETQNLDELLEYADQALYIAKQLGRNNVQSYTTVIH